MIWKWAFQVFSNIASWIVSLLPDADLESLVAHMDGAARVFAWIDKLNDAFPVDHLLLAGGLLLSVYAALYAVMIIRRVFSLIWPGAGS